MCLITDSNIPMVSEKPLICYKVLKKYYGKWKTYIMEFPVSEDVVEGRVPLVAEGDPEYGNSFGSVCVNGGYIHTYKNLCECSGTNRNAESIIYECEIPKNTEYFSGYTMMGFSSYASKSIIFRKRLYRDSGYSVKS